MSRFAIRQFIKVSIMTQRQTLPVLPLRGTVIFPGLTAPIAAGRPGTLRAIEAALKRDRLRFAVAQSAKPGEPRPAPPPVFDIGGLYDRGRHVRRGNDAAQRPRRRVRGAPQGDPRTCGGAW